MMVGASAPLGPMRQTQLSCIPSDPFGGFDSGAGDEFAANVLSLCGAGLGTPILDDLNLLQFQGLAT
jgi:hypothetical protein